MNDRREQSFNERRRTFLRSLGIAAGAAAVSSPAFLFGKAKSLVSGSTASITRMPRIGVLMPGAASGQYNGEHFMAGFTCRLDEIFTTAGVKTAIVVEEYEKSPHAAMSQAKRMIESGTIDILVAPFNADMAAQLRPVLDEHKTILINVDAGANVVRAHEQHPNIFNHTLSHWQSNVDLGRHAVEKYGRNVMVASSLLESGYDALYAFRIGVEDAGGTLTATHVTHGATPAAEAKAAIAEIRAAAPDVVCAMYSGTDAEAFLNAYAQSGLLKRTPLVASSFAVDAHARTARGTSIDGVTSCRAWSRELATDANKTFIERYERFAHHRADAFSVLGYDTAGLIIEAVNAAGGSATDAASLCATLSTLHIESPRGTLVMDAATQTVTAATHLCEVNGHGSAVRHTVIRTIEPPAAMHPALTALTGTARSGFSHAYLTA